MECPGAVPASKPAWDAVLCPATGTCAGPGIYGFVKGGGGHQAAREGLTATWLPPPSFCPEFLQSVCHRGIDPLEGHGAVMTRVIPLRSSPNLGRGSKNICVEESGLCWPCLCSVIPWPEPT